MAAQPSISVVIPSYNSEKFIKRCLKALVSQQTDINYEIVVVDSSKDTTPDIITENFPTVKLVHLEEQTMPGAARNIGVEKARADIIAFIDSDCVAPPDWINMVKKVINQGYSIVGGAVKNANPKSSIGFADFFLTFSEFFQGMPKREVTTVLATCNFICRKNVFQDLGGFHPDLLAGEDYLFCLVAAQKYKLLFDPAIIVYHINREWLKEYFRHQYNFGKHSFLFRKKFQLPGSYFARHTYLSLFLPVARYLRIFWRIIRWNRVLLPHFICNSPVVMIGLCVWTSGFVGIRLKNY